MSLPVFENPFRPAFPLLRYPVRKNELLQAWDRSDELLLTHLKTLGLIQKRILILGDSFGSLSIALEGLEVTTYVDSYVSGQGILKNSGGRLKAVSSFADWTGSYDYALIKLPNNLSFFEDLLCHLTQHLQPNAKVICTGMVKHMTKTSFDLLHRY